MQSSSAHPLDEGSTGEFRPGPEDSAPTSPEDQPTVISHRPPLSPSSSSKLPPDGALTQLAPGTRLEHFELLEYVGGGGMGRVYRAMDTSLSRPVALKILSRQQAADSETLLRFRNEARSAARLNHDGVVQVYYVGEDAGLPFIAFEFVEGVNVRMLVEQKGRLMLAEAVSYTLQVAEALTHAASRNVVHRDVKPSNILIMGDGRAKLIDMGLARLQMADNPDGDLTASGVTLGTFDYISPEQARDPRHADFRSDIYSLGCTFFYMLTGRPPFPQGTVLQKLLQHQGDEPPDVRELRPDLPEEVSRVLRKMMAKDPGRRYQDASKLIMALLVLAELAGLQRVGPGQTVWVAPREPEVSLLERNLPWIAPIAALGAIVLGLHLLWSSSSGPRDALPPPSQVTAAAEPAREALSDDDLQPIDEMDVEAEHSEPAPAAPAANAPEAASKSPRPSAASQANPSAAPSKNPAPANNNVKPTPSALERSAVPGMERSPGALAATAAGSGAPEPMPVEGKPPLPEKRPGEPSADRSSQVAQGRSGGPAAIPTVANQGSVRIVSADGKASAQFASLAAACSAAADGDVIELCYHGRREEKSFSLAGRQVTIRAGEGFQPVVVFRPTEVDPIRYSRSMITLSGNRLTLSRVALELEVPREIPADRWSLFQVSEGQEVNLEGCWLSIRNASEQHTAYHPKVAFFQLASALATDMVMGGEVAMARRSTIKLTDCVARGEAVFLQMNGFQPVSVSWNNGLLATTEYLLVTEGGDRDPLPDETLQLDLQSLTVAAYAGLCRLSQTELAPHPWPLQVHATGSIFVAAAASPLLEQVGVADVAEALARVTWHGEHNFYEGFTVFWRIRQLDPNAPAEVMTFDDWQTYWRPERESLPSWNLVPWRQLPEPTRPVHLHTPNDYLLRGISNPPLGATDAPGIGLRSDRLPALPPEPNG